MTAFLAILVIVSQLALVGAFVVWLVERLGGPAIWSSRVRGVLAGDALRLAALVAVVAMAGSLAFSEVLHYQPCSLCWYQRIAMYPQAVILVIAAVRGDRSVLPYTLVLSAIGAVISIYHYQLERFPDQAQVACSLEVPCTTIWFTHFGYITIPMMALTAFLLIGSLSWIGARHG